MRSFLTIGVKDPLRVIQYRSPVPGEIVGDGRAELFMFILMVLSFIAVMAKVRYETVALVYYLSFFND